MSGLNDAMRADLGRKLSDDISSAISRTVMLADTPADRFMLAIYATASAAGAAVAHAQQAAPSIAPEQAVDEVWAVLRPVVLAAAGGGLRDFRALLRQASKGDGTFKRRRRKA